MTIYLALPSLARSFPAPKTREFSSSPGSNNERVCSSPYGVLPYLTLLRVEIARFTRLATARLCSSSAIHRGGPASGGDPVTVTDDGGRYPPRSLLEPGLSSSPNDEPASTRHQNIDASVEVPVADFAAGLHSAQRSPDLQKYCQKSK